jgi:membrane protease YdiL (CAAX protease family)
MRRYLDVVLPSVLIAIAEALYFTGNTQACLAVHALNVLVCILLPLALLGWDMVLFQAFSLISLIRLVGLGMPVFFSLTLYNFIPVYAVAIVGAFVVLGEGRAIKEQAKAVKDMLISIIRRMRTNLKPWTIFLVVGVLLGYLFSNIEYAIIHPQALVPQIDLFYLLVLGFIMLFFVGFGEELMFRAILQRRMQTRIGIWGGIVLTSVLFAAMHSIYFSFEYLIYVFIVGMILGVAYYRTKSLGLVSLIHGSINFFLFSFLPYGYLRFF